jgi:hypothetical protein
METFTIREAAERCEVSYQAMRKRVDRGSVQVVHKDGVRRIPRAELERIGLWPGAQADAPAEIKRLQAKLDQAHQELKKLRLLPQQVEVERETRERVEQALHEERAEKKSVEQELREVERVQGEIEAQRRAAEAKLQAEAGIAGELRERERRLAQAGFFERRRLLRDLRMQTS